MKILLTIKAEVDVPAPLDPKVLTPQEMAESARTVAERVLMFAFEGTNLSLKITATPFPVTRSSRL